MKLETTLNVEPPKSEPRCICGHSTDRHDIRPPHTCHDCICRSLSYVDILKVVTFRMRESDLDKLHSMAEREHRSISQQIDYIVTKYMEGQMTTDYHDTLEALERIKETIIQNIHRGVFTSEEWIVEECNKAIAKAKS